MTVRETSGTITTGGTAVTVLPINGDRYGLIYANLSSATLIFSATTGQVAAAGVGISVAAGASFQWAGNVIGDRGRVPHGPVTVWGATTGQAFTIAEMTA